MIPEHRSPDPVPLTWRRGALVGGLLFLEATVFTQLRDVGALAAVDMRWAELLVASKYLLTCSIAIGAGLLLFGHEKLRDAVRHHGAVPLRSWPRWLLAHGAGLTVFVVATEVLFRAPPTRPLVGAAWLAVWVLAGLGAAAALLPLVLAPAGWRELGGRGSGALLAGAGVGILAWWAGQQTSVGLVDVLTTPTLWAVRHLLEVIGPTGVLEANGPLVGTESFTVRVGPGCAGFEGIGLVWIFLGGYVWLARGRKRLPMALTLLPLGTAAVWSANVLRIVALILIGHGGAPELAVGAFHTRMGWVFFCAIALALVAICERSTWWLRSAPSAPEADTSPAVAYLAPCFVVLAVRLVGGAFVTDPAAVYPLVVAAGIWALHRWRRGWGPLRVQWSLWGVGAGLVTYVLWRSLAPPEIAAAGPEWTSLVRGPLATPTASLFLVTQVAAAVVVVPWVEELAFRGYLLRRFVSGDVAAVPMGTFTLFSCLASSLLFGLAHDQWIAGTVAGLVYAGVLYRRRLLSDAVIAHGTTNLLLILAA